MQSTITAHVGETKVVGWLHKAKPNNPVLLVLIHGHNSRGTEPRFIELAKHFVHRGIDCLRYSVTREQRGEHTFVVTTASEEIAQAKAIVGKLRHEYDKIIVAGHSQGGLAALQLCLDGLAEGVVFLMSVFDPEAHVDTKLMRFGLTPAQFKTEHAFKNYDERTFIYTPTYFEDLITYKPVSMIANWYGPSLFIYGSRDKTVTEAEMRQGFEAANDPKEFHALVTPHRFTPEVALPMVETIVPWMEKNGLFQEAKR